MSNNQSPADLVRTFLQQSRQDFFRQNCPIQGKPFAERDLPAAGFQLDEIRQALESALGAKALEDALVNELNLGRASFFFDPEAKDMSGLRFTSADRVKVAENVAAIDAVEEFIRDQDDGQRFSDMSAAPRQVFKALGDRFAPGEIYYAFRELVRSGVLRFRVLLSNGHVSAALSATRQYTVLCTSQDGDKCVCAHVRAATGAIAVRKTLEARHLLNLCRPTVRLVAQGYIQSLETAEHWAPQVVRIP